MCSCEWQSAAIAYTAISVMADEKSTVVWHLLLLYTYSRHIYTYIPIYKCFATVDKYNTMSVWTAFTMQRQRHSQGNLVRHDFSNSYGFFSRYAIYNMVMWCAEIKQKNVSKIKKFSWLFLVRIYCMWFHFIIMMHLLMHMIFGQHNMTFRTEIATYLCGIDTHSSDDQINDFIFMTRMDPPNWKDESILKVSKYDTKKLSFHSKFRVIVARQPLHNNFGWITIFLQHMRRIRWLALSLIPRSWVTFFFSSK